MKAWQPAKAEPDALSAAINQTIRHSLMPDSVRPVAARDQEGWTAFVLADGRQAAFNVETRLQPQRQFEGRAIVAYDIIGKAILDRDGFSVVGGVVVDQVTRAFLAVDCRLEPMGRVR